MRYNLIGRTFEKWTVLSFSHTSAGKRFFLCQCACGEKKAVEIYSLTSGRSKSCRKCSARALGEWMKTHGKSKTKVYRTWVSIKTRCFDDKHPSHKYAGAVGVGMFAGWINDFEAFYEYVGDPPTGLHALGRIKLLEDYAPGNVAWITQAKQISNSRAVARLTAAKSKEGENYDNQEPC